jgi:hypothetical protein
MSDEQKAPDVRVLEDRYQILGELHSGAGPRTYIGKRKSDGADVLIRVVRGRKDDNNALAHFASDAQLLTGLEHPNVLGVLESRWLGADSFAVVNERVCGRTLHEMLSAGDLPPHQRAAVVLDDVRSVLDWARERGVVHRGVTPETLFFADVSDQPMVLLTPTPIPIESVPDACEDARTIGMLSYAMLTGESFDGSMTADALAEQRPDLARRVIDETMAMTACRNGGAAPNVENYLGVIANADALKEGEIEVARMQAELMEERRKEREAFEAEQRACAARVQEMEDKLAAERTEFEQRMAEEERQIADVRQQLEVERAQLEQERVEFDERSADLDRARAEVEAIRAEHEQRVAAAVAAAVAATKAEMRAAAQKKPSKFALWGGSDKQVQAQPVVMGDSAGSTPGAVDQKTLMADEPPEQAADDDDSSTQQSLRRPDDVSLVTPTVAAAEAPVEPAHRIVPPPVMRTTSADRVTATPPASDRRMWVLPTSIAGALALIIAIVIGVNHHSSTTPPSTLTIGKTSVVPTAPSVQPGALPRAGFLTQSAAGTLAPRSMSPVLPATSTPAGAAPAGTAPATRTPVSPWPVDTTHRDTVVHTSAAKPKVSDNEERRRPERVTDEAPRPATQPAPAPRQEAARDPLFSLPAPVARDTVRRIDSVVSPIVPPVRRDTVVRRDSVVRPDTTIRPRPDTLTTRR